MGRYFKIVLEELCIVISTVVMICESPYGNQQAWIPIWTVRGIQRKHVNYCNQKTNRTKTLRLLQALICWLLYDLFYFVHTTLLIFISLCGYHESLAYICTLNIDLLCTHVSIFIVQHLWVNILLKCLF